MRPTTLAIAILLTAAFAQPGWAADGRRDKGGDRRNGGEQGGTTAEQAAEKVRRQTGGRVLDVRKSGGGYRVKVLTPSGEVRSVTVPGQR
jgi:hypothetical protein